MGFVLVPQVRRALKTQVFVENEIDLQIFAAIIALNYGQNLSYNEQQHAQRNYLKG